MDVYSNLIRDKNDVWKYFTSENICFLDIETTGLSRKYNQIYLIGIVYFDADSGAWSLKQFFANNMNEEKEILNKFHSIIHQFDLIVTYNGISFDLPFIHHRSMEHSIASKILAIDSFDIYRKIRKDKSYLDLTNLKLTSIEEKLGIYREDEYSGKECIDLYYSYIKNKDQDLKDMILKHNYDDLYYLLDIMKIFDYIDDMKSLVVECGDKMIDIHIEDMMIIESLFKINCTSSRADNDMNIIYYERGFHINWKTYDSLVIDLEFEEGLITPTKKCLFVYKSNLPYGKDLKDFSEFMVPDNIILLKVEDRYEMENIKNIIRSSIKYVLIDQDK